MNALQLGSEAVMDRETAPFDVWLNGELRNLYAEVLEEPVPDELVALILA